MLAFYPCIIIWHLQRDIQAQCILEEPFEGRALMAGEKGTLGRWLHFSPVSPDTLSEQLPHPQKSRCPARRETLGRGGGERKRARLATASESAQAHPKPGRPPPCLAGRLPGQRLG